MAVVDVVVDVVVDALCSGRGCVVVVVVVVVLFPRDRPLVGR